MAKCLLAVVLFLSGCDLLFQIDELHGGADAAPGVEVDSVDAAVQTTQPDAVSNCTVEEFASLGSQWTPFSNPPDTSVAINGALSITLHNASNEHGGLNTAVRDFTGQSIEVDVIAVPDAASETYIDWWRGDDWYSIAVDHGQLSYGFSVNGTDSTVEIPYVPQQHRGFRIA
ncbi:MAG TPA: hypothetical protein VMZ53_03325, partial [Kofleriaceae bacterium]|nr:hypothetical protein [Kofleriaceae bacterium]